MSTPNYLLDALLSNGTYGSNNQNTTQSIKGWRPVKLQFGENYQPANTFGAQLYEKDGQYKLAFRGTIPTRADWRINWEYVINNWHQEWADTIEYAAAAVLYVKNASSATDLSEVRARLTVTGHSQGGFQAQLGLR